MSHSMMSDEDALEYAKYLTSLERKMLCLCSTKQSWGYSGLAEKIGEPYCEIRSAGQNLQSMNLASVKPVRCGREFNGSAIFLNQRGEQVKAVVRRTKTATTQAQR